MAHESDYTKGLLGALRALPNSRWYKIHGGPMQPAGISDIVGVLRGRFVAIEVKDEKRRTQENGGLTALQMKFLADVRAAGGFVCVVYTSADAVAATQEIVAGIRRLGVSGL